MAVNTFDSPILVQSIEAVAVKLRDVCGMPNVKIMGITSEQFTRELGRTSSSDKFLDYWYVMPQNIQSDAPTYNPFALSNVGFATKRIGDSIYKFKLIPIKVTLQCKFFTLSTQSLLNTIQKLCFNKRRASFKLESEGGFDVDIWTEVVTEFDFPNREMASGNSYVLTSTFVLHTYAGQVFKYVPVKEVDLNIQLHSTDDMLEHYKEPPIEEMTPVKFVLKEIEDVEQLGQSGSSFNKNYING